jgi:hypothetical protein
MGGELLKALKPCDPAISQDSPFMGYEAIFDYSNSGSEKVRGLLKLLQSQSVPLNLHAGQIASLKNGA